jgi:hypothetical protein
MNNQYCLPRWVTERQVDSLRSLRLQYTLRCFVVLPSWLVMGALLTHYGIWLDTLFLALLLASMSWFAHCQHRLWLFRPYGPAAREYNRWQCYCIEHQCYLTPDQWRESRRSHV